MSKSIDSIDDNKKVRKSRADLRTALTQGKGKLFVDPREKEEGYTYRWVNIGEGNEQRKENLGYEPVLRSGGNSVRRFIGTSREAVLMRIESDRYEEIQEIKQEECDELDVSLTGAGSNSGLIGGKHQQD
mgnify:CR=1 FL=1